MTSTGDGATLGGRYRLLREIASGGMAVVWAAEDILLGRRVAVKRLHAHYAAEPEFLERFRREARAAASLAHANIVPIYDVGEDPVTGTPYIVMELVEGESLKERIRQSGPLPDRDIRQIGAGIAAALDYAHRRGVIHRDVKPQNVLLDEEGRPRLADFGIAQALASSGLTRTGAVMGSVHYLAPELIRGRPATPRSDVYGLGAVLYEMATGRVPFRGDTDVAVALAHVEQPLPPPHTVNPRIAPDLERTIVRAMAKDPANRQQSAAEVATELRGGQPTARVPVAPPASAAAGARTATLAMPRPATAVAAAPRPTSSRSTVRPRSRSGGFGGPLVLLLALAAVLVALGIGFFGLASFNRDGFFAQPPSATPPPTRQPTPAPTEPPKPVVAPTTEPTPTSVPPSPTAAATETPVATPTSPATAAPTQTAAPSPSATPQPASPTPTRVPATAAPTPSPLRVPNVVGRPLEEALSMLRAAGLTATVRGVNVNAERNTVVAQGPEAGGALPAGGTVQISVASGQVPVPDVSGRTRDEAIRMLTGSGFRVPNVRERRDQRVPVGRAIESNPEAGRVVPRGSEVELIVSADR